MISFVASDGEMDNSLSLAASDAEELSDSVTDPALLPSSSSCNTRLRADEELIRVKGCQWIRAWMVSTCGAISHKAFSRGAPSSPPTTLVPLLLWSSWWAHDIVACPPLISHPSASAALTSVDGTEEKIYEHLPPLNESVAAHLCPPMAIGWKARVSHSSCICTRWTRLLSLTNSFGVRCVRCPA